MFLKLQDLEMTRKKIQEFKYQHVLQTWQIFFVSYIGV